MKDHRKKLVAIAALTISTTAAIHALNRFIEKTAIAKNLMNKGKNSTFQWRFGDVYYTKNGSGSPVLLIPIRRETGFLMPQGYMTVMKCIIW